MGSTFFTFLPTKKQFIKTNFRGLKKQQTTLGKQILLSKLF